MDITSTLLLTDIILPVLMITLGMYFGKLKPKLNEGGFGFRTERSTKNRMTWRFAHKYCGKLWTEFGWDSMIFSLLVMSTLSGMQVTSQTFSVISTVLLASQAFLLLLAVYKTEKGLDKSFDAQGNLKSKDEEHQRIYK